MGKKSPRKYTVEFKVQAVELADELGSIYRAADQLGISKSNIKNWKGEMKAGRLNNKHGEPIKSRSESEKEEINRLRRENEELKKVNFILKRAAAFFSQDHLK